MRGIARAIRRCTRRSSSLGRAQWHRFCCWVLHAPSLLCSSLASHELTEIISRCHAASPKILTAQNNLGMNALHELALLSRAPISRLKQQPYFDAVQHICRPSGAFVAACLQSDTSGKTPLHLAVELPTNGLLHAMLGAAYAHEPENPMWSPGATFALAPQSLDLREQISLFVGGSETRFCASRSVASQTTLRGCWCCSRCNNCLQGRPCVDNSS